MLTPNQINNILDIIKQQNLIFISKQLGPNYLTEDEIVKLKLVGINPLNYYTPENDVIQMSLHFGMISDAIGEQDAKKVTYEDLVDYFKSGRYIPLSEVERMSLESIKKQSLSDIKALEGRIFKDVNNIISIEEKNNREAYEKVIRNEIELGIVNKKTRGEIAREISRKTGDWNRDFGKIVEFHSHNAFEEGRASMFKNRYGKDVMVYKQVYEGGCKHCARLYLKDGIGSEPKVFRLSELESNGTNIGRKVDEWKPIVGSTHPYCRCTMFRYNPKLSWNDKTKTYNIPNENAKEVKENINRKPIRITFNNKEYSV